MKSDVNRQTEQSTHKKSPPEAGFSISMEPGGFEPPCRNSQSVASTRLVTALISAWGRPVTTFPNPARVSFNPLPPEHQRWAILLIIRCQRIAGICADNATASGSHANRREADPTSDVIVGI